MLRGKPKVVVAVFLDVLDEGIAHVIHAKTGKKLFWRGKPATQGGRIDPSVRLSVIAHPIVVVGIHICAIIL